MLFDGCFVIAIITVVHVDAVVLALELVDATIVVVCLIACHC